MPKAGSNKVITKSTEDPFWCDGGREKALAHYLAAEPRRQLYSRAPWEVPTDQAGPATVVEALSQFIKTHLLSIKSFSNLKRSSQRLRRRGRARPPDPRRSLAPSD